MGILRSLTTTLSWDIPVKVVFVQHRSNKREWLAILSTDITLDEEEIIRLYGIHWDIETFFMFNSITLAIVLSRLISPYLVVH